MKLKKIISIITALFVLMTVSPNIIVAGFADDVMSDWTVKTVGNAEVGKDGENIVIRVTGAAKKAANARITSPAYDAGDSLYFQTKFSINDVSVDRKMVFTDSASAVEFAVINGTTLKLFGDFSCEIEADAMHCLQIGVDSKSSEVCAFLDGTVVYRGTWSGMEELDFSKIHFEIYTQIVMLEAESVFTLNSAEIVSYKSPVPQLMPAADKKVLTEDEAQRFILTYTSYVDCSGKEILLKNAVGDELEYNLSEENGGFIITPVQPLTTGNSYSLSVTGVKDIYGNPVSKIIADFLVAPEGYSLPESELLQPTDGESFYTGQTLKIKGSGSSAILDNTVIYADEEVIFRGEGESADTSYTFESEGEHTLTLRVTDTYGGYSEKSVTVNVIRNLPPEITVTAPMDGQRFNVGDTLELVAECSDDQGDVSRVNWYENGELIAELTEAPFELSLPKDSSGGYTYMAEVYDIFGLRAYDEVSVTVNNASKQRIFFNDFNSYQGTVNPENMNGVSTVNGGTYAAGENLSDGTRCFNMMVGEKISGGGPFVMLQANSGGIIGIETDLYIGEEGTVGASFTLRNTSYTIGNVSISNSSLKLANGGTNTNVNIERGVWHRIKYEFDTYRGTYDFYLGGEKVADGFKFKDDVMFGSLGHLRITFSGNNGNIMFDNTEFYKIVEAPYITEAGYVGEDGVIHSAESVPFDTRTFAFRFNTALSQSGVSTDTFTYRDLAGNEFKFDSVILSEDKLHIIAKTANPLLPMSEYTAVPGEDIISENGVSCEGAEFTFKTGPKPVDVKQCGIYVNGIEKENVILSKNDSVKVNTVIINDTGEEKEALIILILKKDDRTHKLYSKTVTLSAGENTVETEKLTAVQNGMTVNVLIWDNWQSRTPITHKIFK